MFSVDNLVMSGYMKVKRKEGLAGFMKHFLSSVSNIFHS